MSEHPLTIAQALALSDGFNSISETPALDLQLLLGHVLEQPRAYLYTWPERPLTADQQHRLICLIERRKLGEPIAHLLGHQGFWSLNLEVSQHTLIPRPETELLVEIALDRLPVSNCRVADLGTGTGAIALALAHERPTWQVVAVDRITAAVQLAERNRTRLGLNNVVVRAGDWCQSLDGRFELIVSNPPYIDADDPHLELGDVRFEPRSALVADCAGLADIEIIADQAVEYLSTDGWLMLEHGWRQGEAVQQLLLERGYRTVKTHQDLQGRDRVTCAQKGGEAGCNG